MKIENFVKHLSRITHIPIGVYTWDGNMIKKNSDRAEQMGILDLDADFLKKYEQRILEENPMLEEVLENVHCGVIRARSGVMCVLGPVLSNASFKMVEHSIRQYFSMPEYEDLQMIEMDFVDFCRVVHMVYEFMTDKEITLNEMLEHHIKTKYIRTQTPLFIKKGLLERSVENVFGGGEKP